MRKERFQLVIAWIDTAKRFDGWRWVQRAPEPRAVMWLRRATCSDISRAREFLAAQGHPLSACYRLPTSERDPLGVARARVLGEWREKGGAA